MINPTTEIGYEIQYQNHGKPDWYVLESPLYEHRTASTFYSESTDLGEVLAVARLVKDGMPYPIKPNRKPVGEVSAVRVIQRIHTGGAILIMGTPHPDSKED